MKGKDRTQATINAMDSATFKRHFLILIVLAWNLPAFVGFGFILLIGVLTPQQVLGILTTPLEPLYILSWQVFVIWFFPRKLQSLADCLNHQVETDSKAVLRAVCQFPVWYWGLFLLYLVFAAVSVVVAADIYTEFVATPMALFRIMLVALIVSIIVGLPIFFLIMDLFGRAMGGLVTERPIITIKTKVFLIGALIPLLIDTMLVQYFWTRTGYFTYETFGVWFVLELLAIGGSLIFVNSFGQSLSPLQSVIDHPGELSVNDYSLLQAKSTDELGVLSGSYRNLLNSQMLSNLELAKNKAEFEAMLNSISDGIIYADTQRRIILINPAITRIFGYSLPELKGKQTKILYANAEDYEQQGRKRYRTDADSNKELYEMQYRRKDQTLFYGETYGTRVIDSEGNVIGLLGIIRDVTEKKKSEVKLMESQQRLSLHFMQTPLGVIEWDLNFNVVDWNPAVENIFGYSKADAMGRHASFIIPNVEKEHVDQVWNELIKNTGGFHSTNENVTKDGNLVQCKWYNTPLVDSDGKVIGITSLVEDITESLRAQEELKKHREHLEELVEDRTAELEALNNELEAFSYSVSHDLRAPLRAIDGFSQALLEDFTDKLGDEGQDYLYRVRSGAGRMALLIDDLLQLSRVGRSELKRTTVDLTQIARDIARDLDEQEPARKVEFDIKTGLKTDGDQRLLTVVMENLLSNAWKYTGKKTSAKIIVGKKKQAGKTVFYVEDNGAGFDMQYAGNLFGAFQRLHRDEEFEGTGIGLATVQRILHRHGGTIKAEAKVDQGASFYFTFGAGGEGSS
jgi:PAS domain S-box-containing protein